jgi:hypothetical protein
MSSKENKKVQIDVSNDISWKTLKSDHNISFINVQDIELDEVPKQSCVFSQQGRMSPEVVKVYRKKARIDERNKIIRAYFVELPMIIVSLLPVLILLRLAFATM